DEGGGRKAKSPPSGPLSTHKEAVSRAWQDSKRHVETSDAAFAESRELIRLREAADQCQRALQSNDVESLARGVEACRQSSLAAERAADAKEDPEGAAKPRKSGKSWLNSWRP
ncbi:unnamed protein product, partial [Polarella glacialis]